MKSNRLRDRGSTLTSVGTGQVSSPVWVQDRYLHQCGHRTGIFTSVGIGQVSSPVGTSPLRSN